MMRAFALLPLMGLVAAALLASDPAAAQVSGAASNGPDPPVRGDQHRSIGGWLAESFGEEENSRAVRISRQGGPLRIEYLASFWHGNRGPYYQVSAARRGQACGGESWRRDPASEVWRPEEDIAAAARDVRARLAAALESCGGGDREIAALLTGFEPAYEVAAPWADQDRRYVLAVGATIATYGAEHPSEAPSDRRRDLAGWRVEDLRTPFGRLVRIGRRGRSYALEYHLHFARTLDTPQVGATFRSGRCRSGDLDGPDNPDWEESLEALRERFAVYLRECRVSAERQAEIFTGLDAAYALFLDWARQAAPLIGADNAR